MRLHAALILIVALALSVYNTLQVRRLRREVRALQVLTARQNEQSADRSVQIRHLLDQARQHSARAQELTRKGDLEGARREWKRSLELATEAAQLEEGEGTSSPVREVVGKLTQRVEELIVQLRSKKPSENTPRPRKGE